jgi:hypothetical protein
MPLKRKESLRKGLQRISQRRLHSVLQMIVREGPTADSVHEARKIDQESPGDFATCSWSTRHRGPQRAQPDSAGLRGQVFPAAERSGYSRHLRESLFG